MVLEITVQNIITAASLVTSALLLIKYFKYDNTHLPKLLE